MSAALADVRRLVQIAATAAAAMLALSASRLPSQAQTGHMLMIPASDGYGFDDCLSGNKACGKTIADAWCEAHGMAAAASFGRAEDVTASIAIKTGTIGGAGTAGKPLSEQVVAKSAASAIEPGAFIVNCRD